MWPWGKGTLAIPVLWVLAILVACSGGTSSQPTPLPGLAELCQPLARAERHRYTFAYTLDSPKPEGEVDETAVGDPPFALQPDSPDFLFAQHFDGAIENPDKLQVTVRTEDMEGEFQMIFIGDGQWVRLGDSWSETSDQPIPFPPVEMCDAIASGLDLTGLSPTADTIDGVKTLRYEAKDVELGTAAQVWGEESDPGRVVKKFAVKVWISEEDDMPVRMESKGVGTLPSGRELSMELTLEVRDVNADDIEISPPM